jgi:hypothetical protein
MTTKTHTRSSNSVTDIVADNDPDLPLSTLSDPESDHTILLDLKSRVDNLESSNSILTDHSEIFMELLKLFAEVPAGRQIFNRALNRHRLARLQKVVLPRRQAQLADILSETSMPAPIREQFVSQEMQLLKTVLRAISHRSYYEEHAAITFRTVLIQFFEKILATRNSNLSKSIKASKTSHKNQKKLVARHTST